MRTVNGGTIRVCPVVHDCHSYYHRYNDYLYQPHDCVANL